jgi:hypothetical protein
MSTIKAVVRNGHIETEEPLDLPEGTELLIPIPDRSAADEMAAIDFMTEDEQSDDPEEVEEWVDDLRSIPPVPENPEKETESRAWDETMRQFNIEAVRKQFEEGTP